MNEELKQAIEEFYNKLFELDEFESYKHFDSIEEANKYHELYVSIKQALKDNQSKLDKISEVIKERDRRVYYTIENKYNKIKQILGDEKNE